MNAAIVVTAAPLVVVEVDDSTITSRIRTVCARCAQCGDRVDPNARPNLCTDCSSVRLPFTD